MARAGDVNQIYHRAVGRRKAARLADPQPAVLPKVLLLDEITSALDDVNKRNVNEIIHRYAREQNIAVLWVTHDANEITHSDDVITLQPHGGKMQEANRG